FDGVIGIKVHSLTAMLPGNAAAPDNPQNHAAQTADGFCLVREAAVVGYDKAAVLNTIPGGVPPQPRPELLSDARPAPLRAERLHRVAGRLALQPWMRDFLQVALDMSIG